MKTDVEMCVGAGAVVISYLDFMSMVPLRGIYLQVTLAECWNALVKGRAGDSCITGSRVQPPEDTVKSWSVYEVPVCTEGHTGESLGGMFCNVGTDWHRTYGSIRKS